MSGFMDDAEQARADEDDRLEREAVEQAEADARAEKGPLPMRLAIYRSLRTAGLGRMRSLERAFAAPADALDHCGAFAESEAWARRCAAGLRQLGRSDLADAFMGFNTLDARLRYLKWAQAQLEHDPDFGDAA